MKIILNGNETEVNNGINILELINSQNLSTPMFAVEKNLEIISKSDYENTIISDGDRIEIVNFVGGG